MAVMVWCKAWQLSNPFRSGTDDEDTPADLINVIEEEYSSYDGWI